LTCASDYFFRKTKVQIRIFGSLETTERPKKNDLERQTSKKAKLQDAKKEKNHKQVEKQQSH
jgi:nucleoid DNA-binding protein